MQQFTFHVVSLPHTKVSKEYLHCAFTQKVLKFVQMMKSLGHKVILYSPGSDVNCDEQVQTIDPSTWNLLSDWREDFSNIIWDPLDFVWTQSNENTVREMKKRIQPKDFICLIGGNVQKQVSDALPEYMSVEIGIGYLGAFAAYKVFESYAWMHYIYGLYKTLNGNNYDVVIPNYWDPNDFCLAKEKKDYFLYIGRVINRKGVKTALELAKKMNKKLIVAGQGVVDYKPGKIVAREITLEYENLEYAGIVDAPARAKLMGEAKAVLVPTQYIGPFEGVSIEAMMCGTPVITTDFGCFTETVVNGVNGYRTRTLGEMVYAANHLDSMNPYDIRRLAVINYSMDRVKFLYQAYFEQLHTLWGSGWYSEDYNPKYNRYLRVME